MERLTEREALEELKTFPISCLDFKENQALDMAIKALEKQVAKKPIDKIMYLECPTCGDVGILDCGYCPVCGQKLDWE